MASSYSPSLKIELIGNGDQSGTWGTTTNNNLGTILEQAITGVQSIVMSNADYTLTSYNGVSDEARNAVLVVTGTNSAIRQVICPLVEKLYVIYNNTTGGYAITIGGATGSTVTIPNGVTAQAYCDGTNFFSSQTGSAGNFNINGNLSVTGTTALTGALTGTTGVFSGAISSVSPAFTGTPTAPTATAGTNTTQIATTAFVATATGGLGTMSTQNANAVAITGGTLANVSLSNVTISSVATPITVAQGGTGATSLTANSVVLGNGTSAVQVVAPNTSGNVLTSNGTTWQSTAPAVFLPAFGAIGSYAFVAINASSTSVPVAGNTYSAGSGSNQIQSALVSNQPAAGSFNYVLTDNLTGTWRWMGGSNNGTGAASYQFGLAQRIS